MADVAIEDEFVDCTSVSITYDIMGIATVNYTIVYKLLDATEDPPFLYYNPVEYGQRTFEGYISSMNLNQIPDTEGWYECQVTLITTTD